MSQRALNDPARLALARLRRRARGVSLLTAVFLVVVLAGLAAAIARVSLVQSSSGALDMLGVQAYQAARSGLEWGMFQQLRLAPADGNCIASLASPNSFALPSDAGLRNFTVTVRCVKHGGNAPGSTTNRWTISAVACNQPRPGPGDKCPNASPDPDYVQRQVQAELN